MLPMLGAIAPLAKILFSTIEKCVPDKDLQEKLKAQLNQQLLQSSTEELKAAASIVEAEAKAGWFTASWRPLLMYVLIFILVWNYILGPVIKIFTGTIITFELPGDVWTLLQIGLGGYVVGRSGESIARTLANRTTTNYNNTNDKE
jgi:Holin of 3TMs, for gene-transfer release